MASLSSRPCRAKSSSSTLISVVYTKFNVAFRPCNDFLFCERKHTSRKQIKRRLKRVAAHLEVTDEGGRSRGDKASLGQDARLHVAEFQAGVVTGHLTCSGGGHRQDKGGQGSGVGRKRRRDTATQTISSPNWTILLNFIRVKGR